MHIVSQLPLKGNNACMAARIEVSRWIEIDKCDRNEKRRKRLRGNSGNFSHIENKLDW